MTTEQKNQQKLIDANTKAQQEMSDKEFKKKARFSALSAAQFVKITEPTGENRNVNNKEILIEADKIYQWLIKGLK